MDSSEIDDARNDAKRKRRVRKACVPCSKAHVSCENIRPCKRCVDRGMMDKCTDKERKTRTSPNTPFFNSIEVYTDSPIKTPSVSSESPTPPSISPPENVTSNLTDLIESEIESNFLAIMLHVAAQSTEENIDHLIKLESMYTNRAVELIRERFKTIMSKSEIDKLLLDTSRDRIRFWKFLTTRPRAEKLMSSDIFLFAVEESPRLMQAIKETVEKYRVFMEPLAAPVIFFDRCGTVHYVNPAYKALTGFQFTLPTEVTEFAFYKHIVSPETLVDILKLETQAMQESPDFGNINAYVTKCGVRLHREIGEKYLQGNMALNFKRDFVGVPLLYIGTFFPTEFPSWIFKESHANLTL